MYATQFWAKLTFRHTSDHFWHFLALSKHLKPFQVASSWNQIRVWTNTCHTISRRLQRFIVLLFCQIPTMMSTSSPPPPTPGRVYCLQPICWASPKVESPHSAANLHPSADASISDPHKITGSQLHSQNLKELRVLLKCPPEHNESSNKPQSLTYPMNHLINLPAHDHCLSSSSFRKIVVYERILISMTHHYGFILSPDPDCQLHPQVLSHTLALFFPFSQPKHTSDL